MWHDEDTPRDTRGDRLRRGQQRGSQLLRAGNKPIASHRRAADLCLHFRIEGWQIPARLQQRERLKTL